jgi:hypothetical protein
MLTEATTPQGLAVKARAALLYWGVPAPESTSDAFDAFSAEDIMWHLSRNILKIVAST